MSELFGKLELRVPPPLLLLVFAALAWLMSQALPVAAIHPISLAAATVLGAAGLALNLLPKLWFRRAGTTVNPLRPEAASALVTSGVYRISRNPMYLGHVVLLLAWASSLGNGFGLVLVPVHIAYLTRFQVMPEERILQTRFPERYAEYMRSTRRWV